MMNNISVIGRLVADPEQREYNGRNVTNFVLASDSSARNSDGNFITNFYRVSAWGNASDTIYKYSKKGDLLGVCGSFSTREYSSKDGSKHISLDINLTSFTFCSSANRANKENNTANSNETSSEQASNLPF